MQDRDPADPFGHPPRGQLHAGLVAHVNVVMGLGPIIANKDHLLFLLRSGSMTDEPEGHPRGLMDQCSRHDTPSVLSVTLTNQPGHVLNPEIEVSVGESAHRKAARSPPSPSSGNRWWIPISWSGRPPRSTGSPTVVSNSAWALATHPGIHRHGAPPRSTRRKEASSDRVR